MGEIDNDILVDLLRESKDRGDKDIFVELMQEVYKRGLGNPNLMIEAIDIILDALDEWGWLDRMIEYTSNLVKENPSDAQSKTELATYYYKKGELDKAEIILASSLEFEDNMLAKHYLSRIRNQRSQKR
jgi:tetratricopeptide (TPR) repeat protein